MLNQKISNVRITFVEVRHLSCKPSVLHNFFVNSTGIRIKYSLIFSIGIRIRRPLMQPVFHRHILYGKMILADVIVYSILDNFHFPCMHCFYKFMVTFFTAEPWINRIMICKRITMFRSVRYIVYDNGC